MEWRHDAIGAKHNGRPRLLTSGGCTKAVRCRFLNWLTMGASSASDVIDDPYDGHRVTQFAQRKRLSGPLVHCFCSF